jgi:DNA polymerase-3 subunit chi
VTEIGFYVHAADKLDVARKLAIKAFNAGQQVMIYTPDADLAAAIDTLLWTRPPLAFVPHCLDSHPLAPQTPILIGTCSDALASMDVMINLHDERPQDFARFARLLEIVAGDPDDIARGRQRYRFYRERGYPLSNIDLRQPA